MISYRSLLYSTTVLYDMVHGAVDIPYCFTSSHKTFNRGLEYYHTFCSYVGQIYYTFLCIVN